MLRKKSSAFFDEILEPGVEWLDFAWRHPVVVRADKENPGLLAKAFGLFLLLESLKASFRFLITKNSRALAQDFLSFVTMTGFEPARLAAPPPQDGESTNFSTWPGKRFSIK